MPRNVFCPANKCFTAATMAKGFDSIGMPESETNPTKATQELVVASQGEPVAQPEQLAEFLAQLHETLAHSRQLAAYLETVVVQAQKDLGNTEEGPPEIVDPLRKRMVGRESGANLESHPSARMKKA